MSITHHPVESMLAAFAAGTLDHGQHIAVATHLMACRQCRTFARSIEQVGGAVLSSMAPAVMSPDALARVQAQLDTGHREVAAVKPALAVASDIPGLPKFVRSYELGKWIWVAPSVHVRRVALPYQSDTRVFLLRSGPGTRMMEHTHSGFEMTCVLTGAFEQAGSVYGPGDFDFGDPSHDHEPFVQPGEDCICLVAMQGQLRLKGLLGRILQPFIRL